MGGVLLLIWTYEKDILSSNAQTNSKEQKELSKYEELDTQCKTRTDPITACWSIFPKKDPRVWDWDHNTQMGQVEKPFTCMRSRAGISHFGKAWSSEGLPRPWKKLKLRSLTWRNSNATFHLLSAMGEKKISCKKWRPQACVMSVCGVQIYIIIHVLWESQTKTLTWKFNL